MNFIMQLLLYYTKLTRIGLCYMYYNISWQIAEVDYLKSEYRKQTKMNGNPI